MVICLQGETQHYDADIACPTWTRFSPEDLTTWGSEDKTTMKDDTSKEEFSARESIAAAGPSSDQQTMGFTYHSWISRHIGPRHDADPPKVGRSMHVCPRCRELC